jgi:MSHA biogenesis protein MshL
LSRIHLSLTLVAAASLLGCAAPGPEVSRGHLGLPSGSGLDQPTKTNDAPIPSLGGYVPPLPSPKVAAAQETYSVVVNDVSVQTLLFAVARDAKLNLDIHPSIRGNVTLNALDQTIFEILSRVARQVDMRFELDGKNLYVLPDTPFLRIYKMDYPNITREAQSETGSQSQVSSTGQGSTAGNSSTSSIKNVSNNRFWITLTENLRDLLRETDKVIPADAQPAVAAPAAVTAPSALSLVPTSGGTATAAVSGRPATQAAPVQAVAQATFREAASVIANPETGVISIRATSKQHERVREFLDQVIGNSRRQVLIEATILEVELTNSYQQGINWSFIRNAVNGNTDLSIVQAPGGGTSTSVGTNQPFLGAINFARRGTNFDITAVLNLLESFGKTRVLSSPKVSVMNNQSALLKVVDNKVYFTIDVVLGTAATSNAAATPSTYRSVVNTVPVGFLMNVTAQVGDDNGITLSLRPTVSRITSYVQDPNPVLAEAGVVSRIPEIQTREFESIMKVNDGEVAVLGGLMQDSGINATDQIPFLGNLPGIGDAFRYKSSTGYKSELVIFLRPTILRDASINGDAAFVRDQLSPAALGAQRARP